MRFNYQDYNELCAKLGTYRAKILLTHANLETVYVFSEEGTLIVSDLGDTWKTIQNSPEEYLQLTRHDLPELQKLCDSHRVELIWDDREGDPWFEFRCVVADGMIIESAVEGVTDVIADVFAERLLT